MRGTGKRALWAALILFFAGVILLGITRVWALLGEYARGQAVYSDLSKYANLSRGNGKDFGFPESQPPETEDGPQVDFEALGEINSDIVGWLSIEGLEVNYPIVQGADNDYYLTHLFSGEVNRAGCIFLDCGNSPDFSDRNNVVYGHHLKNGTMFSVLLKYKKQEFYEEHPTALLLTPAGNYEVRFFSGFVSSVWGEAWNLEPSDAWAAEMAAKSMFSGGPTPQPGDTVLTLSTCSYEFQNARFVLLGIMTAV